MLTATTALTCPQCAMPIAPSDATDLIDDELCCEDCVIAYRYATSGL
ncbi:hypothetical protein ABT095_25690 [Kitasatospora sp. NPDC002227]